MYVLRLYGGLLLARARPNCPRGEEAQKQGTSSTDSSLEVLTGCSRFEATAAWNNFGTEDTKVVKASLPLTRARPDQDVLLLERKNTLAKRLKKQYAGKRARIPW